MSSMNAKGMFEELGYKYKYLPNSHRIEFFKDKDEEMHFVYNEIIFNKKFKTIKIKGYFDLEELQAINKQVEELGWNER